MKRRHDEHGGTLLVSMFIVMLVFLVTMAVTTRATLTIGAVERGVWRARAFNAAEAALAIAVQDILAAEIPTDLTRRARGSPQTRRRSSVSAGS